MSSSEQLNWVEPKWAREQHRPSLLRFARGVVPKRWLLLVGAGLVLCIPVAWILANLYGQPLAPLLGISVGVVSLFSLGLPALFLLLAYALCLFTANRVVVEKGKVTYGAKVLPSAVTVHMTLDREIPEQPRIRFPLQVQESEEIWIGVAPDVDLGVLERLLTNSN